MQQMRGRNARLKRGVERPTGPGRAGRGVEGSGLPGAGRPQPSVPASPAAHRGHGSRRPAPGLEGPRRPRAAREGLQAGPPEGPARALTPSRGGAGRT